MDDIKKEKIIPPINAQNGGETLKNALVCSGILLPHVFLLIFHTMDSLIWKIEVVFFAMIALWLYIDGIYMEFLRYKIIRNGEKYHGTIQKCYYVQYHGCQVYYYDVEYMNGKEICQFRTGGMMEDFHQKLNSADVDVYIWDDKKLIYGFQRKKLFHRSIKIPISKISSE